MFILIVFLITLFLLIKKSSVSIFIILIYIVSLFGTLFTGREIKMESLLDYIVILTTTVLLLLIILPWKDYDNIKYIIVMNNNKINKLTKFLLIINSIVFIILLTTTIIVQLTIEDINAFKYSEGAATEFYYTMLPFDTRLFILTTYLYGFSYFLLPLHFYYLSIHNYRLSFISFLFSLNIILYGTTYFSRSVIIHYIFLYIAFYLILRNTLNKTINTKIKKTAIIFGGILLIYFIGVTESRFEDDLFYENTIPYSSEIKNPKHYSYIDYLSQWYFNGFDVLTDYRAETFKGQITFQPILSLLGSYNLIDYNTTEYQKLRMRLWKNNWYTFTGFTAYIIYDFGIILSFLFCFIFYYLVKKNKPKNNSIKLTNLFLIVLLIQIPLMGIFYSQLGGLIIPFIFYLSIIFFLKMKLSHYVVLPKN